MNAGQSLDDHGNARQSPEIRAISLGPRSLAQGPLDTLALRGAQFRLTAGPAGALQCSGPAALPLFVPSTDALSAYLKVSSYGGQDQLARREQPRGTLSTLLQSLKISSRMIWTMHTISIL
ncbi:MAG: hypothetical protein WCC06_12130 [Candidatus Aminicenantales bacterium]